MSAGQRRRQSRPERAVIRPELRALARSIADAFWSGRQVALAPDRGDAPILAAQMARRR